MTNIDKIVLVRGAGTRESNELCVMTLAALIAGEQHTDRPVCACPVLSAMAIRLNDGPWWSSDKERTELLAPLAPKLVGTRADAGVELLRAKVLVDLALHTLVPDALESAARVHTSADHAAALRMAATNLREAVPGGARTARAAAYAAAAAIHTYDAAAAIHTYDAAAAAVDAATSAAIHTHDAAAAAVDAATSAAIHTYDAAAAALAADAAAVDAAADYADKNKIRDSLLQALIAACDIT
jgi:hypothetical protein